MNETEKQRNVSIIKYSNFLHKDPVKIQYEFQSEEQRDDFSAAYHNLIEKHRVVLDEERKREKEREKQGNQIQSIDQIQDEDFEDFFKHKQSTIEGDEKGTVDPSIQLGFDSNNLQKEDQDQNNERISKESTKSDPEQELARELEEQVRKRQLLLAQSSKDFHALDQSESDLIVVDDSHHISESDIENRFFPSRSTEKFVHLFRCTHSQSIASEDSVCSLILSSEALYALCKKFVALPAASEAVDLQRQETTEYDLLFRIPLSMITFLCIGLNYQWFK